MIASILTETSYSAMFDDGVYLTVVKENEPNTVCSFELIKTELQNKTDDEVDWDYIRELMSPIQAVNKFVSKEDRIVVVDGTIRYKGEILHNALVERILDMHKQSMDVSSLISFLDNMMENPSKTAQEELYGFLEFCNLPITSDGHFLAFKRVRYDYTDVHSGTFDNSIGRVVSIPRSSVDSDSSRTCSYGLHFCSKEYLNHFTGDHTMILKINPADVVAIPKDYNNSKGRCCAYQVVGEIDSPEHTNKLDATRF